MGLTHIINPIHFPALVFGFFNEGFDEKYRVVERALCVRNLPVCIVLVCLFLLAGPRSSVRRAHPW